MIQKHDATCLHDDLLLELDDVFKSWAVTSGPSLDPQDRRLAVDSPPSCAGWIHKIKFDGYCIQMRAENGEVTLKTRKGLDWTSKWPVIALSATKLPDCIIDVEICALDENGAPDFACFRQSSPRTKQTIS
ncbi:hypothetical protein ASG68_24470 [Rhizobium sp. Leaf453]|uniref:DNA polymerase ligase N-terminal domain-containing protein n=1 Tax=Rhizobium sp. Leaf391 TaxID=1736360 RepID=UPI0007149413|nr:hypothetical protein ASG42_28680 [Rhizobium sp. Leaf391]KQT06793.1 hypothetical protein ASG50_13825 [Rhizobium sp. Leaf386]KQU05919.1 hypothetical protein ASG68_24470 [Rhizobium sp. Leaf453]